jgi:hypothetical protein
VYSELVEYCRLIGDVRVDNILLEEAARVEERREGLTDVQIISIEGPLLEPRPSTGPVTVL